MNLLSKSDEEILKVVNPIMDNLMEGSTEIDHAKHIKDFSTRIINHITPEQLEEMCLAYQSKWGTFQKREFISLFRRKDSIAVVWKQFVSKISDEFVAEAVFKEENGKVVVDHALVF